MLHTYEMLINTHKLLKSLLWAIPRRPVPPYTQSDAHSHTHTHTYSRGVGYKLSSPGSPADTSRGRCGWCHFMCTHAAPYKPLTHTLGRKHPRRAHTHSLSGSLQLLHPTPSGSRLGAGYPRLWWGGRGAHRVTSCSVQSGCVGCSFLLKVSTVLLKVSQTDFHDAVTRLFRLTMFQKSFL